jgi:hypothetical protein
MRTLRQVEMGTEPGKAAFGGGAADVTGRASLAVMFGQTSEAPEIPPAGFSHFREN